MPKFKEAIPEWLEQWKFDRFVTLATNGSMLPAGRAGALNDRLTGLLKEWDGRMNRALVGSKWATRKEDRMWAFYFLEKAGSNAHWHGLIKFVPHLPLRAESRADVFDLKAEPVWKRLVPAGTVKTLPIFEQRGVADYIAKALPYAVSYEHFVTADQF